jgi:AraC-like DNA-binding protein
MKQKPVSRLERSCVPSGDWMRAAPSTPGLERIEARFCGHGFDPHRHDSYAIGFTLEGVQAFRYRGTVERSTPGQVFVLHPDELHDGYAGTGAGFRYRILYVEPRLIHEALGGGHPLPFVCQAVSNDARLKYAVVPALAELDLPLEDLRRDQIVLALSTALAAADKSFASRMRPQSCWRSVNIARAYLDASAGKTVTSVELETLTGQSRYALARQFRSHLGTSPYRYLVMRRLDRARVMIRQGMALAEAALACGFADQSHMTRQFRQAYGLPPGRWATLTA